MAASGNGVRRRSEVVTAQENMKVLAAVNGPKKEEWSMVSTSAGYVADELRSMRLCVSSLCVWSPCVRASVSLCVCGSVSL